MRLEVRIYYSLILASIVFTSEMIIISNSQCVDCGLYGRCLQWSVNSTVDLCDRCACPTEISGNCCQIVPTPCNPDPCGINEECVLLSATYYGCKCMPGFTGDLGCNDTLTYCSYMSTLIPAETYTEIIGEEWSSSTSMEYWTDSTSSWICQDCQQMKCQNNGTCAYNSTDQAVCVCEIGYTGDYCEIEEGCANKPCLNGGLCVNINTIDYECECLSIYNGTNCEEFKPCEVSPCNNGSCIDMLNETFICDCNPGYNGTFCEEIIDMCNPNPCSLNASCNSLINDYECDCPENSGGKNCSDITDFCQSQIYASVCNQNDTKATCSFAYQNFSCSCSPNWAGEYCNITTRVYEILQYFPNATRSTINFLESVSNSTTLLTAATTFIAATLPDLSDISWQAEEIFEWVAYEKREINYTDEFSDFTDSSIGRCFTFNHPKSQTLFKVQGPGEDNGLSMMLKVNQDEYLETFETAALKIYIHPYNQLIFGESLSFNAMPAASSTLRVYKSTHLSLGGNYGACAATSKDVKVYSYIGNYSVDACLWSCYQSRLYSVCGCMDPRYEVRKRIPTCTVDQAACVFSFNKVNGDPSTWGIFCDCPPECTKIQYHALFEGSDFPVDPIECQALTGLAYQSCMEDFEDKALINIYFPVTTQFVYEEMPQWDFNTMLSYYGGLVGVVSGFSIVSIFEVIYLLYRAILVMCTNESATLEEVDIASVDSSDENEEKARKEELEALKSEIADDAPTEDVSENKS